ncbi:uncharacterized protein LOC105836855 isoform X2 [Monomorium pharaonis]|uniref:uncharacterized protein LOC105836855 isoform X2 n=1 Tax=Monomorium pharaonis TaxID=307658 RepID=UPI00174679D4|nr:uncharacterized protein LOC105836855 isoform X2 [Monomorium pharaonis]
MEVEPMCIVENETCRKSTERIPRRFIWSRSSHISKSLNRKTAVIGVIIVNAQSSKYKLAGKKAAQRYQQRYRRCCQELRSPVTESASVSRVSRRDWSTVLSMLSRAICAPVDFKSVSYGTLCGTPGLARESLPYFSRQLRV